MTARIDPADVRRQLMESFGAACAAGKPKTARRLLESFYMMDYYWFGGSDLYDRVRPKSNDGPDGYLWLPPNVPTDRRHGANWPLWRTQVELDELRQQSRVRAASNEFAQGMLRNLRNNVIGKGYTYKIAALDDEGKPAPPESLTPEGAAFVLAVQRVVDRFLRLNHWNCSINPDDMTALAATREQDTYNTVRIDGECFLRFYGQEDGTCLVRQIDAAQIRDGGKYLPQEGWTFGIQHQMEPFEDVETPLTYVVFWPDVSAKGGTGGSSTDRGSWDEEDAADVLHLKGPETPSNVKRGLPLFIFGLGEALDRASRLQRNMSLGSSIRAAIAETVQLAQATQTQIQSMASALAYANQTNGVTGQTTPVERIQPGTMRRVPEGWELVQPSQDYSEQYAHSRDGDLQAAASGAGIASFVLGGLESGNYSNFESASYPPVQNAQCEQEYYKMAFARAVWKAIQWAAQCGLLPSDVSKRVTLTVEAPAVLHRNELEKAQEDQIAIQSGWKDRQTCAAERGLDWHQVQANNEEYQERMQELMPELPMPGEDGDGGDGHKGNGQPPKPKLPQASPGRATREGREASLRASPFGSSVRESKDAEGHEHDNKGLFTGSGGGGGQGKSKKGLSADDPVHSYLDAFKDTSGSPATAQQAREANKELKSEGSKHRIVPDGKGGWEARHIADLKSDYGDKWVVATNPLTGQPEVGDADYYQELKGLAGDKETQSYLHAFNDPSGGEVKPEEAAEANQELERGGSKYRLVHSKDYGAWIAKPASDKQVHESKDSSGHEHDNKGQFTGSGGGGGGGGGGEGGKHEAGRREFRAAKKEFNSHVPELLGAHNQLDISKEGKDAVEVFDKLDQAVMDVFEPDKADSRLAILGDVIQFAGEFQRQAAGRGNQILAKHVGKAAEKMRAALGQMAALRSGDE